MNGDAAARLPWAMRCVLLLLALAALAPYPWSTFTPDTARDLEAAIAIAAGNAFPRQGSLIAGTLHLGPLWFYVLSLAVMLSHSMAGISLCVGAVAALKFPLAYLTGKALGGVRTGFFVAVAVAIPGIAAMESLTWSHVNLVGTAAWLTLWCAANAWKRDDARWLLAAGAALGIALHAHPTAIVLAPALLAQIIARRRLDARGAAALAGAVVLALLPLALAWMNEAARNETATLAAAVGAQMRSHGAGGTLAIVASLLFGVADLADGAFLHRNGVPDLAWVVAQRAIWAIVLAGVCVVALRGTAPERRLLLAASVLFMAAIALVAALRPYTPFYMASAAATALALAAGVALRALSGARRIARTAAMGAVGLIAIMHVALAVGAVERARDGWLRTPLAAVSDLKSLWRTERAEPLFPALTRDALGRALCRAPSAVVLHGEFATALDMTFDQETRLACGRAGLVTLGGAASSSHWAGLPRAVSRTLGLTPQRRIGSYDLVVPDQIVGPAIPHAVSSAARYPPHAFGGAPPVALDVSFRAPANSAILLGNPLPWYLPVGEIVLSRDGIVMDAQVSSSSLVGWRCRTCGAAPATWTLHLRTVDPAWIDVLVLR